MMNTIKYILPFLVLGLIIFLPVADVFAQGPSCCPFPPDVSTCGGLPPCTPVPLDGGITALLVAGIAYGAKRMYGKSKS